MRAAGGGAVCVWGGGSGRRLLLSPEGKLQRQQRQRWRPLTAGQLHNDESNIGEGSMAKADGNAVSNSAAARALPP